MHEMLERDGERKIEREREGGEGGVEEERDTRAKCKDRRISAE